MNFVKAIKRGMSECEFLMDGIKAVDLLNPYYIDRKTLYEYLKAEGKEFTGDTVEVCTDGTN